MIWKKSLTIVALGVVFTTCYTIFAQADKPTKQVDAKSCVSLLPKKIVEEILIKNSGWKILEFSDLSPDDQVIWKQTSANYCPGVAIGDFSGDGRQTYAVAIILDAGKRQEEKLFFADLKNDVLTITELNSENNVTFFAAVRKGTPGEYKDVYDRTKKISIKNETIVYIHLESSAVTFYMRNNKFEKLLVSD